MASSYLPAGVTDRMYDPIYFHDDPLFECAECLREVYEGTMHRVNGEDVCSECVEICHLCGEFFNDKTIPGKIIVIHFRDQQNDGQISDPSCPKCAADWVLGTFLGCAGTFDSDDYPGEWGKDAIAQLLAQAFPLPKKEPATVALSAKEVSDAA